MKVTDFALSSQNEARMLPAVVPSEAPVIQYRRIPVLELQGGFLSSAAAVAEHFLAGGSLIMSAAIGAGTLLGWRLMMGTDATLADAYGLARGLPAEVVERMMREATEALNRIRHAADKVGNARQKELMSDILELAADIMEQLRTHPAKMPSASRFLQVYLDGAAAVSEKFSDIGRRITPDTESSFTDFLTQAKDVCVRQQRALVADDLFSLDVELDVLKRRMKAEA